MLHRRVGLGRIFGLAGLGLLDFFRRIGIEEAVRNVGIRWRKAFDLVEDLSRLFVLAGKVQHEPGYDSGIHVLGVLVQELLNI